MASYFVASEAAADGFPAVHDRSRCPPAHFPHGAAREYLGEFDDVAQAVAVARIRYAGARGCACCEDVSTTLPAVAGGAAVLSPLRT